MNRRSRLTVAVGIVLFLGLALGWTLWFPYNPQRVRAAIPRDAILVSEHHHLVADVDALLQNVPLQQSIRVLGGQPDEVAAFMTSGFGRWLTLCLGGRYTLTAYAPFSSDGGPAAWMLASWGGVHAQVMRWLMEGGWISGWTRLPGRSPVPCYSLNGKANEPVLSAAIYEGVVLMCYSRDRAGVRTMVRRLAYGDASSDLPAQTVVRDRLQVRWNGSGAEGARGKLLWNVSDTNQLVAHISWPVNMPLPVIRQQSYRGGIPRIVPGGRLPLITASIPPASNGPDTDLLRACLGSVSGGLWVAPSAVLAPWLSTLPSPMWSQLYNETLHPWVREEGVMALGLLREQYSGRLLGIKTPSLVLAIQVREDLDLGEMLPPLLDRWNAALGLALLARERHGEDEPAYFIIDDARNGIYSSMKAVEKPALWRMGHWLFIASNLEAAREISRRMEEPVTELPQGAWWQVAAAQPGDVHGWIDFVAAGTAFRKLTALYAIVQIAQGERSGPAVTLMENTGRAVSAMEPFATGTFRLQLTPQDWTLDARVGHGVGWEP